MWFICIFCCFFIYQTVTYAGQGITQHLYSYTTCINLDFGITYKLRSLWYYPVSKAFVKSRDYLCLIWVCLLWPVVTTRLLLLGNALHGPHIYNNAIKQDIYKQIIWTIYVQIRIILQACMLIDSYEVHSLFFNKTESPIITGGASPSSLCLRQSMYWTSKGGSVITDRINSTLMGHKDPGLTGSHPPTHTLRHPFTPTLTHIYTPTLQSCKLFLQPLFIILIAVSNKPY